MVINLQIVCRMLNRVPTLGSVHNSIIRLFALLCCFLNMKTVREGWSSLKKERWIWLLLQVQRDNQGSLVVYAYQLSKIIKMKSTDFTWLRRFTSHREYYSACEDSCVLWLRGTRVISACRLIFNKKHVLQTLLGSVKDIYRSERV